MDWKDFAKKHFMKFITLPAVISGLTFLLNILLALNDGVIDDKEFHNLMTSSSGVQMVILFLVMIVLKRK